jgi:hypothetical protein
MTRSAWILALLVTAPAVAQDSADFFRIGDDVYLAGTSVELATAGVDDVFAAGERVDLSAAITGSAHLAGRRVNGDAEIGGDLYAAGAEITLRAPVAGDATLTGYDIDILAAVGADLRAGGANLHVEAPIGGTALFAGRSVEINAVIAGDTAVAAEDIKFGPEARIDGRLRLYGEDVNDVVVPDRVAPADRIERFHVSERVGSGFTERGPRIAHLVIGFVVGVLLITVLATLVATLAPQNLEQTRQVTRDRPLRTIWIGFLTLAALIGSSVLLVLTLIGVLVAPAVIVLAVGLGILGYVIATYLVGRALWGWFGALPPDTFLERALTALIGAVAVALIALVPFLGWLAVLVLTLTGLGAFAVGVFRPELRTRP